MPIKSIWSNPFFSFKIFIVFFAAAIEANSSLKVNEKKISSNIFTSTNLEEGKGLSKKEIIYLRPGFGLNENEVKKFLGKKIKFKIDKFKPIKKNHFI